MSLPRPTSLPLVLAAGALLASAACRPASVDSARDACVTVVHEGTELDAPTRRDQDNEAIMLANGEWWTVNFVAGLDAWVRIDLIDDDEYTLFADTGEILQALHFADENRNRLPPPLPDSFCPEQIPEHYDMTLSPGSYHLQLAPTDANRVRLHIAKTVAHSHPDPE